METVEFGKYLLLRQIGMGRIGQLWKAKVLGVKGLEKFLAIKRVHPHLSTERAVIDIFMESASSLVHLQHENIVRVYDFGTAEGTPYIAMDFVVGKDLDHLMKALRGKGQALGIEEALFIVTQVCSALDFAYNFKDNEAATGKIIHGGIRPQNVMISKNGEIKLTDFCISRILFEAVEDKQGTFEKTLPYLAPEVVKGAPLDETADVFCLGVLLCELVTGRSLSNCSPPELVSRIGSDQWDPREMIPEDLSPSLQDILGRSIAPDPSDRYQTPGQMLVDLEEYGKEIGCGAEGKALAEYMDNLFGEELLEEQEEEGLEDEVAQGGALGPSVGQLKKARGPLELLKKKAVLAGGIALIIIVALVLVFWPRGRQTDSSRGNALQTAQTAEEKPQTEVGASQEAPSAEEQGGTQPVEREAVSATTTEKAPTETETAGQVETPLSQKAKEMKPRIDEGLKALEEERYQEAVRAFESILKEAPELKENVTAPYAQALEGLGLKLEDKQPKKAIRLLAKATELNPESIEANFHLGLIYVEAKQYPKAIKRYEKVIQLDPQYADAYFNLGYIYAVTKKYDKAEEAYKHVVDLAPPYLDEALFNLAMVQKRLGKKDECIENLKRAVIVNPKNKLAKKYLKKLSGK